MEDFLIKFQIYFEVVCQAIGALAVLASIIVRVTPSKKDDEIVSKVGKAFLWVVKRAPTIGLNPNTKKIEDAYEDMKKKLVDSKPVEENPKAEQ